MTYLWKSEYLEQYARGDIIVNAENVEEARIKALRGFDIFDREEFDLDYMGEEELFGQEEISARKKVFLKDISVEPLLINDHHFIYGSA